MKIYLVGGAVRDKLLNIPVKDKDWVVVGAGVDDMLKLNFQQVGKDFPVFIHPQSKEEYALARTERKIAKGHTGFAVNVSREVSLEDDLQRRDLTINAIAEDDQGNLIDPFHGRDDIEAKILRHVSPAFAEDPLRVLRVARFAARFNHLGFRIAQETLKLMETITDSGELQALAPERIWHETKSALDEASPEIFFSVLNACGALAIVFPELDLNEASVAALIKTSNLSKVSSIRFAALCHPLDQQAYSALCKRLRAPNEFLELGKLLLLVQASSAWKKLRQADYQAEDILDFLELGDAFRRPQRFSDLLITMEGIALSQNDKDFYPRKQTIQAILKLTEKIDAREFVDAGYKAEEIGIQIRQKRLTLIIEYLKHADK